MTEPPFDLFADDPRVRRALAVAARDRVIVAAFRLRRVLGEPAHLAIRALADEHFLSEEHIRTIVYAKKRPRP